MVGGTHGCIYPDVKGTSDCLKYQLVHLMHVHALQQARRLEVIHSMLLPSCVFISKFV